MSQLEKRIEMALLHEVDEYKRAELIAKKALYWARIGLFAEAKGSIQSVRASFADGRSGRVTCLLMLAEGVLLYFEGLQLKGAMDRVSRANLLGSAMRDREIAALSSAWRAYLEFEDSRFDSCARSLAQALESQNDTPQSALSRASLVLLTAFSMIGSQADTQFWFKRGHATAVEEGDQATIEALLHNKVAFGVARELAQIALGNTNPIAVKILRGEVTSARSLQHLAGIGAHSQYIDLVDVHLCIIERNFHKALELLDRVAIEPKFPTGHVNEAALAVERAFCILNIGGDPGPHLSSLRWDGSDFEQLDVDDRLVHAWMLSQLVGDKSGVGQVDLANAQLGVAKADYHAMLEDLRRSFGRFAAA